MQVLRLSVGINRIVWGVVSVRPNIYCLSGFDFVFGYVLLVLLISLVYFDGVGEGFLGAGPFMVIIDVDCMLRHIVSIKMHLHSLKVVEFFLELVSYI